MYNKVKNENTRNICRPPHVNAFYLKKNMKMMKNNNNNNIIIFIIK